MKIIELSERPDLIDEGIKYFWNCWGNDSNFNFYEDCIRHSLGQPGRLPKFYLALEGDKIIGSYALLVNDIISRQDLVPWLSSLHVNEDQRGQGYAAQLLEHGRQQSQQMGFDRFYLSTDLEGFYEKKGWQYFAPGYNPLGKASKIYTKATTPQ